MNNSTFKLGGGGGGKLYLDTVSLTSNNSTATKTYTIPAGIIGTNNSLRITPLFSNGAMASGGGTLTITCSYGGQSLTAMTLTSPGTSGNMIGSIDIFLNANGTVSAQKMLSRYSFFQTSIGAGSPARIGADFQATTVNSAVAQNLVLDVITSNANITIESVIIELIS